MPVIVEPFLQRRQLEQQGIASLQRGVQDTAEMVQQQLYRYQLEKQKEDDQVAKGIEATAAQYGGFASAHFPPEVVDKYEKIRGIKLPRDDQGNILPSRAEQINAALGPITPELAGQLMKVTKPSPSQAEVGVETRKEQGLATRAGAHEAGLENRSLRTEGGLNRRLIYSEQGKGTRQDKALQNALDVVNTREGYENTRFAAGQEGENRRFDLGLQQRQAEEGGRQTRFATGEEGKNRRYTLDINERINEELGRMQRHTEGELGKSERQGQRILGASDLENQRAGHAMERLREGDALKRGQIHLQDQLAREADVRLRPSGFALYKGKIIPEEDASEQGPGVPSGVLKPGARPLNMYEYPVMLRSHNYRLLGQDLQEKLNLGMNKLLHDTKESANMKSIVQTIEHTKDKATQHLLQTNVFRTMLQNEHVPEADIQKALADRKTVDAMWWFMRPFAADPIGAAEKKGIQLQNAPGLTDQGNQGPITPPPPPPEPKPRTLEDVMRDNGYPPSGP